MQNQFVIAFSKSFQSPGVNMGVRYREEEEEPWGPAHRSAKKCKLIMVLPPSVIYFEPFSLNSLPEQCEKALEDS